MCIQHTNNHPYQWTLFTEDAESAELLLKVSPCLEVSSPLEDVKQCNTSPYLCTVSLLTLSGRKQHQVEMLCLILLTSCDISLLVVLALLV